MSVEIEDITLSEEYSMRIQTARKETQATYIFLRKGSPVSELTGVPPLQLAPQSAIAREVRTQLLNIEGKTSDKIKVEDIDEEQRLIE